MLEKLSSAFKLWINYLPRIPRLIRYSLGQKITNLFIEITELILIAGFTEKSQKLPILQKAAVKHDLLKYFLQTAFELKAIENNHISSLAVPLADVGQQLGAWIKDLAKQTPPK